MRAARGLLTLAVPVTLALFATPVVADDSVESDLQAEQAHAQDLQDSEEAYLDYLQSDPEVTCQPRARAGYGTLQVHDPDVGAVFAKDAAEWTVQCNSTAEPLPVYELELKAHFDYWDGDEWIHMDPFHTTNTEGECEKPSVEGQAVILDCMVAKTYTLNHVSLGHKHRAHFKITKPFAVIQDYYSYTTWGQTLKATSE